MTDDIKSWSLEELESAYVQRELQLKKALEEIKDLKTRYSHLQADAKDVVQAHDEMEKENNELETKCAKLEVVLSEAKALSDRLEFIHNDETYKSVWFLAHNHAGPYAGPTYTEELRALRHALSAIDSALKPTCDHKQYDRRCRRLKP